MRVDLKMYGVIMDAQVTENKRTDSGQNQLASNSTVATRAHVIKTSFYRIKSAVPG